MKSERVPQAGSPAVEGIAIGRAAVWARDPEPRGEAGTAEEERGRVARAHHRAARGVEDLVRLLPPAEAELFLPELAILAELGPILLARVSEGATAEQAIFEATARVSTDLLLDARARLLDGLGGEGRTVESLLDGRDGDLVLITESLTPSVVAALPARVVGVVAAAHGTPGGRGQNASHAVILARGRGIPIAFLPSTVVVAIAEGEPVILDTTENPASVWVAPDDATLAEAGRKQQEWVLRRAREEEADSAGGDPLARLGIEVQVNIGSVHDRFPPSAAGIGLLRTELVFSGHARPPSELEQFAVLRAIAAPLGNGPMVVRLFDAGGDKPLAWLPAPEATPLARGVELLFLHPELLDVQIRAIARIAEQTSTRILLPLVRCADDVEQIRARSQGRLPVGAMIETAEAVERIDEVVAAADFICIGTNDLFASVAGQDRTDEAPPLDARMLQMVERVISAAHAHRRKVSVCGEMAGDSRGARILVGLGVDAISVAPACFAKVKLSLGNVTIDDCRGLAQDALKDRRIGK